MRTVFVTLAILCLACVFAQAQSEASADHGSSLKSSDAAGPELQNVKPEHSAVSSVTLKSVGPSSPEEAARITAKSLANQKDSGNSNPPGEKKNQSKAQAVDQNKADEAVMEFHAAGYGSAGSLSAPAALHDKATKSALKRVHGDLYGGKSGAGRADGGSVGATSRSGKTSVYVGSDQARSTTPLPQ